MLNGIIDVDMLEALANKLEALGGVRAILEGSVRLTGTEGQTNIIRVDRDCNVRLPAGMTQMMHPELRRVGPAEYDLAQVEQWKHPDQDGDYDKMPSLRTIYYHLRDNGLLNRCLGLADGIEIGWRRNDELCCYLSVRGEDDHLQGFLWRSVLQSEDGEIYVPYVSCSNSVSRAGDSPRVDWMRVRDRKIERKQVALMFPPKT